jgi:hypothetical protein
LNGFLIGEDHLLVLDNQLLVGKDVVLRHLRSLTGPAMDGQ